MAFKGGRNFQFTTLLFAALLSCASWSVCVAVRDVDPCKFFPNNTNIRDPDDCSLGVTCIDFKSVYTTKCSGTTPFYDKDKNTCAKTLSDDTLCQVSCAKYKGQFIPDPKSCFGYYYCQDEEWARYGQCPHPTHFDAEKQECVQTYSSNCTVTDLDFCTIVKNGVNFNDESSCEKYFSCKSGNLTSTSCKDKYYDSVTGKCIQKSHVYCPKHPYPSNVCGTVKKPVTGFVADGATCRGTFNCAAVEGGPDPAPAWAQCAPNTFFNGKKVNSCSHPLDVKCTADRCDGRNLTFVSSGTKGCRHYLRCANGITVEELNCGNKFFDEAAGVCTSEILKYPSCS